ncbi:site-2 protease family protein [Xylophilus rhododendri]|uniref:Site-2 protease family protein n=1 Tax=Xylophilus rhododendri TaxID=2697032 RepID=A0A857J146_9BURK|nr:site-2 protease family protein [Xylophilus rhododendri]QHI97600.1 site-2 protease family protein [Xylophilus rhododendri]
METSQLIQTVLVNALPLLFAITVHEAAHGFAARRFGDDTAYRMGRLTLNPLRHIDPVGTVLMPALMFFATSGSFAFGYAKPVPVNFDRLRNPRRDMVLVALAGPASNFIQAFLWAALLIVLLGAGVQERFFLQMAQSGIRWNLVMWAFNLFPLPPLDGGRVLAGLLPPRAARVLDRIEPYGFFIVMGLVVAGVVASLWMLPLIGLGELVLKWLLTPVVTLMRF